MEPSNSPLLICAKEHDRAIRLAAERGFSRAAEQNRLRYGGAGPRPWAWIDSIEVLLGRPPRSELIVDDSARQLYDWSRIIDYIATQNFQCEYIGLWRRESTNVLLRQFVGRVRALGICAVCKTPPETVLLYEKPGLLHFIHRKGKECRVAVDMNDLKGALETLTKATRPVMVERRAPADEWQWQEIERMRDYWLVNATVSLERAPEPRKPALPEVLALTTIRKVKL